MTGGEILVECLCQHGVEVIFGMPGGHLVRLYEALYKRRDAIRHILVRHEGAASFMADGYARTTGQVGVCLTIPGPGATNAASGIAAALTECVPVLIITGHPETHLAGKDPTKMFHGLDQRRFFEPITQWTARAERIEDIPALVAQAFTRLRTGRPRPVHLEFPADVLATTVAGTTASLEVAPENPPSNPLPVPEVRRAADLLAQADRPVILAGGGVAHADAGAELAAMAHLLQAPVMTTMFGKGVLSEESPLSLCDLSGSPAQTALAEANAVLAVGTRFPQIDMNEWKMVLPQPLIHLEADAAAIGAEYHPEVGLAGDAKTGLQQLLTELQGRPRSDGWGARREQLRAAAEQEMHSHPYLSVLREELARDAILINDVNYFSYATRHAFPVYDPHCYAYPYCYVAMGYGLPGALGAKAAFPDRQVVSLSGDGGFLMTAQELSTAVQFDLPVIALVVNDHCLTSIRRGQESEFGATLGVELHNPDFVQFAASFGARAWCVDTPESFRQALRKALDAKVVSVIEIIPPELDS